MAMAPPEINTLAGEVNTPAGGDHDVSHLSEQWGMESPFERHDVDSSSKFSRNISNNGSVHSPRPRTRSVTSCAYENPIQLNPALNTGKGTCYSYDNCSMMEMKHESMPVYQSVNNGSGTGGQESGQMNLHQRNEMITPGGGPYQFPVMCGWPNVPYIMPYMPPGYSMQHGATPMALGQQYFYGEPYIDPQQQPTVKPTHQDQNQQFTWQPQPLTPAADPDQKEPPRIHSMPTTVIYDGRGSWQEFYTKFSKLSRMHHWNRKECKDHLRWCLKGEASEFYVFVLQDDNISFMDLIAKMERRFGAKDMPEKAVNVPETAVITFNTAKQEADENLDEWADRVQTLAIKAFGALQEEHTTKQCVLIFCQGVKNIEAGETVAQRHPANLEDALDKMKWAIYKQRQTSLRATEESRAKEESQQSPAIMTGQAPVTVAVEMPENSLESRVKILEGHIQRMETTVMGCTKTNKVSAMSNGLNRITAITKMLFLSLEHVQRSDVCSYPPTSLTIAHSSMHDKQHLVNRTPAKQLHMPSSIPGRQLCLPFCSPLALSNSPEHLVDSTASLTRVQCSYLSTLSSLESSSAISISCSLRNIVPSAVSPTQAQSSCSPAFVPTHVESSPAQQPSWSSSALAQSEAPRNMVMSATSPPHEQCSCFSTASHLQPSSAPPLFCSSHSHVHPDLSSTDTFSPYSATNIPQSGLQTMSQCYTCDEARVSDLSGSVHSQSSQATQSGLRHHIRGPTHILDDTRVPTRQGYSTRRHSVLKVNVQARHPHNSRSHIANRYLAHETLGQTGLVRTVKDPTTFRGGGYE